VKEKTGGAKPGLLASLGKRFFMPEKAEPIFTPDRPVIEVTGRCANCTAN